MRLLAVLVFALIAGGAVYYLLPFSAGTEEPEANVLVVQGECDLSHTPCLAQDKLGHELSISLSPRPVPLLEAVLIEVTVKGMGSLRAAQASIEGLNMYMGIQLIPLVIGSAKRSSNPSHQRLTGTLTLPVCTSRKMDWRMTLVLQTNTGQHRAVFPFTTVTP